MALWYVPLYTIMVILMLLYAMVVVKLCRTQRKWTGRFDPLEEKAWEKMRKQIHPLMSYPLIFFLLNIPIFVNRLHGLVDPRHPIPALWFLAAGAFPLEGAIIAIAFTLDPSTRRRMTLANFRAACREFGRRKRIEEYPIQDNTEAEISLEENLLRKKDMRRGNDL